MNTQDLENFAQKLKESTIQGKGYVVLSSTEGLTFYEVDEVRLKLFLHQEAESRKVWKGIENANLDEKLTKW